MQRMVSVKVVCFILYILLFQLFMEFELPVPEKRSFMKELVSKEKAAGPGQCGFASCPPETDSIKPATSSGFSFLILLGSKEGSNILKFPAPTECIDHVAQLCKHVSLLSLLHKLFSICCQPYQQQLIQNCNSLEQDWV